jgi:hypothetical protein
MQSQPGFVKGLRLFRRQTAPPERLKLGNKRLLSFLLSRQGAEFCFLDGIGDAMFLGIRPNGLGPTAEFLDELASSPGRRVVGAGSSPPVLTSVPSMERGGPVGYVIRTQTTYENDISSEPKLPQNPPQPQAPNPAAAGPTELGGSRTTHDAGQQYPLRIEWQDAGHRLRRPGRRSPDSATLGSGGGIDQNLELLKVHLPYHESDHVLNMAYNVLVGGERLEDIELRRQDESFLNGLGAQRIPDPTTAGDFTRRFDVQAITQLQECINRTRQRVWQQQRRASQPPARRPALLHA